MIVLELSYYFKGKASEVAVNYLKERLWEALDRGKFEIETKLQIGRWTNGGFCLTVLFINCGIDGDPLKEAESLLGFIRQLLERLNIRIDVEKLVKLDGSRVEMN
ncbi:MAG TPA: hypothetical protein PLO21_11370 [Mesotoga sp.]|nr:hypothetical protein [Mesotoga sp.]MDD4479613.1 hypothetical protein [Mesotoga sp.]MDD5745128.1 hypothetical protein [Mesotoga sp.]HOI64271.1 hypothetical protein [Mesotoga sp.]HPB62748.1 hypothetical protein [Mesotoga sp.]